MGNGNGKCYMPYMLYSPNGVWAGGTHVTDQIIIVFRLYPLCFVCAFNYRWDIEARFVFDLSRLMFDEAEIGPHCLPGCLAKLHLG